ncbi:hypothetical protein D3C84_1195540 [compost metagenome]
MDRLKGYVKEGKELTPEEQCKVAYTVAYKQLSQRIERGEILDTNDLKDVLKDANNRHYAEYMATDIIATRDEMDNMNLW